MGADIKSKFQQISIIRVSARWSKLWKLSDDPCLEPAVNIRETGPDRLHIAERDNG